MGRVATSRGDTLRAIYNLLLPGLLWQPPTWLTRLVFSYGSLLFLVMMQTLSIILRYKRKFVKPGEPPSYANAAEELRKIFRMTTFVHSLLTFSNLSKGLLQLVA